MDSSLAIGHTGTDTCDLQARMSLSRFFRTVRNSNFFVKLATLRRFGVRALLLVDVLVGLWLAGTYIYIFLALSGGGTVGEPDSIIARTELWLSIGVTCWFLWQVPYWVLKLLREPHVLNATEIAGEGEQEKDKRL